MANLVQKSTIIAEQSAKIEELSQRFNEKKVEDLIFSSEKFEKCITLVQQGARTDVPILIFGETGTGKEALAKIVHTMSKRKKQKYLTVNCAAIPPSLIESELFGHEKGAFTGAVAQKKGIFEEAHGGTLFLDEIGELPLQMQAHLLRVLQEGEISRVGSTKPISVDVRIVSATNVNLEQAVEEGTFRKDLFYRLSVFPVTVPPIRKRGRDALLLAQYFLKEYQQTYGTIKLKFSKSCEKAIIDYSWPGNVRDIQNRIQRAVITAMDSTLTEDSLGLDNTHTSSEGALISLREAREKVDRELIEQALERYPKNLTKAAQVLDIDRKSLRLLIEKYNM